MKNNLLKFIDPKIVELDEFKSGEQLGDDYLKLNANENMYSFPKKLKKKLFNTLSNLSPNLYPDESSLKLRKTIAKKYKINKNMVLAENGSTAVLSLLFRLFLKENDKVDFLVPTYPLYYTLSKIQGSRVNEIRYNNNKIPIQKLVKTNSKMIVLVNPNAPMGTFNEIKEIENLLKKIKNKVVVVDEAYADFIKKSSLNLIKKYKNLIVVKSFSKSQSLAGVRIGFCFAHKIVIKNLNKIRNINNMNIYSQEIAIFALKNDFFTKNVKKINENRDWLTKELNKLNFEVIKSHTNFILIKSNILTDKEIYEKLKASKILVRLLNTNTSYNIRISIGKSKDMKCLIAELKRIIKDKKGEI